MVFTERRSSVCLIHKKKDITFNLSAGEPCCQVTGLFPAVVFSLALIYFCVKTEPNDTCQPAEKDSSVLTFSNGLRKAFWVFSPDGRVCSFDSSFSQSVQTCLPVLHSSCFSNKPLLTLEEDQVKAVETPFYWGNPCCQKMDCFH